MWPFGRDGREYGSRGRRGGGWVALGAGLSGAESCGRGEPSRGGGGERAVSVGVGDGVSSGCSAPWGAGESAGSAGGRCGDAGWSDPGLEWGEEVPWTASTGEGHCVSRGSDEPWLWKSAVEGGGEGWPLSGEPWFESGATEVSLATVIEDDSVTETMAEGTSSAGGG